MLLALLFIFARRRGANPPNPSFNWTERDMREFVREVESIGVPAETALLVYAAETNLDPHASSGIAWGLPQMLGNTLRSIGWQSKPSDFGTLSVFMQAPWIAKLLALQARIIGFVPKDPLDLYVANFKPSAAANREDVLYVKGSDAYAKNYRLDRKNKGFISRSDLADRLDLARNLSTYKQAIEMLERIRGTNG